jgi:hypothetical protein
MRSFALRRTVRICITMLIAVLVFVFFGLAGGTLQASGYRSGWVLLGLVVFLASYNLRKLLPFLPLGSSAAWLQFHIYCGFLTFLLFAIHIRFSVPNGVFECLLAVLYLTVFISGVVGLYLTRTYPQRLTNLGKEVVFEDIPVARRKLHEEIESLVLECNSEGETSAITEFYRQSVHPFIVGQRGTFSHLTRGVSGHWRRLMRAIDDQNRYLNEEERLVLVELKELINQKNQLDAQYAFQGALRLWLFIHIPATYSLLIFAFFHSVLVHAWSGVLP